MRDTEALGAGDPGAVEALFGGRTEAGARAALVEAYRRFGWLAARLDPLGLRPPETPAELDPAAHGFTAADAAPLAAAYCGTLGWEFGHLLDGARRAWLAARAEAAWAPGADDRARALELIARGEQLEAAFGRRMPGVKTFGLAGAEGILVLTDAVLRAAVALGARRVLTAGMHRGRFTQMGLNFGKPLVRLVAEAQGTPEVPAGTGAQSDVPYHLGFDGAVAIAGREVPIWVAPHPSHLSLVGPMMQGRARAAVEAEGARAVLPLIVHSEAAFAGQGVNAEVLQLSGLAPWHIGGTVHLVINNQIGFTTEPGEGRTARTPVDIARLIEAPVLHVNGDDPDALIRAGQVAAAYRAAFGADIVVELVAYRRKGHNEIDEPRFTQPLLYQAIDAMPPLSVRYAREIGAEADQGRFADELDAAFAAARDWAPNGPEAPPRGLVTDIEDRLCATVETGVDPDALRALGVQLTRLPEGFAAHPKVARFLAERAQAIEAGEGIDWATAEALALASLA
ncbi:MAG TPA: thiamine pyrophosphate-dependent enzyme, partial [Thermohalobaculum sp.]|nr:thiamine pyrophosphate-dependent enzyme [Thermohalobaculum sp.]